LYLKDEKKVFDDQTNEISNEKTAIKDGNNKLLKERKKKREE